MDGDSVDVGVVHKPDDLIREQLSIILAGQVGLSRFGRVELENTFLNKSIFILIILLPADPF